MKNRSEVTAPSVIQQALKKANKLRLEEKYYQAYLEYENARIAMDDYPTIEIIDGWKECTEGILFCKLKTYSISFTNAKKELKNIIESDESLKEHFKEVQSIIDDLDVEIQRNEEDKKEVYKNFRDYNLGYANCVYEASDGLLNLNVDNKPESLSREVKTSIKMLGFKADILDSIEKLKNAKKALVKAAIYHIRSGETDRKTKASNNNTNQYKDETSMKILQSKIHIYEQIADLYMDYYEKTKNNNSNDSNTQTHSKIKSLLSAAKYYKKAIVVSEKFSNKFLDGNKSSLVFLYLSQLSVLDALIQHNIDRNRNVAAIKKFLVDKNISDLIDELSDQDRESNKNELQGYIDLYVDHDDILTVSDNLLIASDHSADESKSSRKRKEKSDRVQSTIADSDEENAISDSENKKTPAPVDSESDFDIVIVKKPKTSNENSNNSENVELAFNLDDIRDLEFAPDLFPNGASSYQPNDDMEKPDSHLEIISTTLTQPISDESNRVESDLSHRESNPAALCDTGGLLYGEDEEGRPYYFGVLNAPNNNNNNNQKTDNTQGQNVQKTTLLAHSIFSKSKNNENPEIYYQNQFEDIMEFLAKNTDNYEKQIILHALAQISDSFKLTSFDQELQSKTEGTSESYFNQAIQNYINGITQSDFAESLFNIVITSLKTNQLILINTHLSDLFSQLNGNEKLAP